MKKQSFRFKTVLVLLALVFAGSEIYAQKTISFDLAGIRNTRKDVTGLNVSAFYHFSEKLVGGIEMNRFFPVVKKTSTEEIKISAWDFDFNFHYILPIKKNWKWYPLTGFSHTSEKEYVAGISWGEYTIQRFWSFNTGAGMLWELGKVVPHIEYNFTWGHLNQQFLLAGLSFELSWGKKKKEE